MAAPLTMPKLSDSMADAVILRWLKGPGEGFRRGEPLLEVETDKATVVYEAELDGELEEILVPEGASAGVGEPIATLVGGSATAGAASPSVGAAPVEAATSTVAVRADASRTNGTAAAARPNATPVARRTALELGLSLHDVAGTGPGGRITGDDVRRAAGPVGAGARLGHGERPRRDRRRRADRDAGDDRAAHGAVGSNDPRLHRVRGRRTCRRSSPTGGRRVKTAPALRRRSTISSSGRPRSRSASFLVSTPRGSRANRAHARVNVGIAVAVDDALLVPVVVDADELTLVRDRRRDAPARRRRRARRTLDARGAAGRHVHGLEPRDVRCALVHGDRRSAAGGDPRGRRRPARRRSRRRRRGRLPRRDDPDAELRPSRRLRGGRRAVPVPHPRAARAAAHARAADDRRRSSSATPSATRSTRSSRRDERVIFFGEDVAIAGRRLRHDAWAATRSTAPSASSTRRSRSWRSPAPRSAPP